MFVFLFKIFNKLKLILFGLCLILWVFTPFMMADVIHKIKYSHGRILPKGSIISFFDSVHPYYMICHILSVFLAFLILGGKIQTISTHGWKKGLGIISLSVVLIDIILFLLFFYAASMF